MRSAIWFVLALIVPLAALAEEKKDEGLPGLIFNSEFEWSVRSGLDWNPWEIRIPRMMTWAGYNAECAPTNKEVSGICRNERNFCALIVLLCKSCCYDVEGNLEKETSQPCGICSQVVIGNPW